MSDEALQYSHSGSRYLLGYGAGFFGIWQRDDASTPLHRFPRTDEGWREAWVAYVGLEPEHVEVGLRGASTIAPAPTDATAGPNGPGGDVGRRRASPGWWILPVLFGLLGGVIAWTQVRRFDRPAATAMLALGLFESLLAAWYLYG